MTDLARGLRRAAVRRVASACASSRQRQAERGEPPTRRKSRRDAVAASAVPKRRHGSRAEHRDIVEHGPAPVLRSMVERKLLRVQQRPEQVAEHLVLAGRRRPAASAPPSASSSRRQPATASPGTARRSPSSSSVFAFSSAASRPSPARIFCTHALAVLQVQQLRQRHVAVPLAGAGRHALGAAEQRQEVRVRARVRAAGPPARRRG